MNEFQRLICYLKVAYNNLGVLHRNLTRDESWFANHEQIAVWYGNAAEQLDDLTEAGLSLGYAEPSIKDAVLQFGEDVLSAEPRERRDTFTRCRDMFRSIAGMMQAAEAITPPDVQNKLQEYEYRWNKESNYKLTHALGDVKRGAAAEEDDD